MRVPSLGGMIGGFGLNQKKDNPYYTYPTDPKDPVVMIRANTTVDKVYEEVLARSRQMGRQITDLNKETDKNRLSKLMGCFGTGTCYIPEPLTYNITYPYGDSNNLS
jgi:hypothetical protein